MVPFGKDPMGSKDEVKEECCYIRMLSECVIVYGRNNSLKPNKQEKTWYAHL